MEGTSPLTISCRAARQRAINFSEFYDSPRQRYARFTAKVEESFARSLARAQESFSFVRSFARSLARSQRKVRQDLRRADAVFLRLQESICIVLVSPLPVFPLSPDSSLAMPARFPTPFAFRGEFFPSPTLCRSHHPNAPVVLFDRPLMFY